MRKILATIALGGLLAGGATTANANDLFLGDDDAVSVALDFTFNYYGVDYNNIFVGSNGFITFGAGDNDFTETVPEFLDGAPRIAGFWDDLTPPNGTSVTAKGDANSMTITFNDIPEFSDVGSNNFSMTLNANGSIELSYFGMTADDAIVGLSPGGGLGSPGDAVDFSSSPTWALPGAGDQAIYQEFVSGFDLDGMTLSFVVPAPGALALLGLAGLVSRRRRRA